MADEEVGGVEEERLLPLLFAIVVIDVILTPLSACQGNLLEIYIISGLDPCKNNASNM